MYRKVSVKTNKRLEFTPTACPSEIFFRSLPAIRRRRYACGCKPSVMDILKILLTLVAVEKDKPKHANGGADRKRQAAHYRSDERPGAPPRFMCSQAVAGDHLRNGKQNRCDENDRKYHSKECHKELRWRITSF